MTKSSRGRKGLVRGPAPGVPPAPRDDAPSAAADQTLLLVDQAQAMGASDPRRVAASVAMFERLAEHWSLRWDERETLLGGIAKSTWSEWRQRPMTARIKPDTRERIANLFTIDWNAHSLFAPEFADRWIRRPNADFDNESPLTMMLRGKVEDVISVRRYLERVRTSSAATPEAVRFGATSKEPLVSCLPGEAIALEDDDGAIPALRRATAIYEKLSRRKPDRYGPVLDATLSALAMSLEGAGITWLAPLSRRAADVGSQVTSEARISQTEAVRPDSGLNRWQVTLQVSVVDQITRVAQVDPTFTEAVLSWCEQIEAEPYHFPLESGGGAIHIARMTHHQVMWRLAFIVTETRRIVTILTIEPEATA